MRNECPLQEEAVGPSAGGRGGGGGHTGQVLQSGENQAETAGRGGGAVCGSGEGMSPSQMNTRHTSHINMKPADASVQSEQRRIYKSPPGIKARW